MLNWLNSFASVSLRPQEPTSPTFVSRLAAAGLHRAGNKKRSRSWFPEGR